MSTSEKENFVFGQIFNMTLVATVQRSMTYRINTVEKDRVNFRHNLQTLLMSLSEQYRKAISEATHCENIEGKTWSVRCAAVSAMRRVLHEGHTPRPLQRGVCVGLGA